MNASLEGQTTLAMYENRYPIIRSLYDAYDRLNTLCFHDQLPPLPITIELQAYGKALASCRYHSSKPTLNFSTHLLNHHKLSYVVDVVLHEMMHAAVHMLEEPLPIWANDRPTHSDYGSHNSPQWCAQIMRLSPIIGLGEIISAPWIKARHAKNPEPGAPAGLYRRPMLPDAISRAAARSWPHSVRPHGFYDDPRPWYDR